MNTRSLAPGVILIALGALFLVVQLTGVGGEAVVAVIGGAFLLVYASTRQYGFLVPGGIMTGLGLGILWQTQSTADGGGVVLVGLGAGFLSIYLIDLVLRRTSALWWPIIPGGILTTIGVLVEMDRVDILADLRWGWPLILIAIGAIVLITQVRRAGRDGATSRDTIVSGMGGPIERREPRPSEPAPQHH
jgi:hypothetical protein